MGNCTFVLSAGSAYDNPDYSFLFESGGRLGEPVYSESYEHPLAFDAISCADDDGDDCYVAGNADTGNKTELAVAPVGPIYTALGDSYSSGEGAGEYLSGTSVAGSNECDQSEVAYSELIADKYPDYGQEFDFAACSGAIVANIWGIGTTAKPGTVGLPGAGEWNQPPQLSQVTPTDKYITISVGGNDVGFGELGAACVLGNCQTAVDQIFNPRLKVLESGGTEEIDDVNGVVEDPAPCEQSKSKVCTPGTYSIPCPSSKDNCTPGVPIGTAYIVQVPSLTKLYEEIAERAPHAQIQVVLYPPILPTSITDTECAVYGKTVFLPKASVSALSGIRNGLNNAIIAAVKNTHNSNIHYVNPTVQSSQFKGKWLCNTPSPNPKKQPYATSVNSDFNGLILNWKEFYSQKLKDPGSFHPNAKGQADLASLIEQESASLSGSH